MRHLFAMLVVGLSLGCSGVKLTVKQPEQPLQLRGAFVYPFGFRWEEPAYRSFELSQRLTDVAVDRMGEVLEIWGPSEFKVSKADDDGAWVSSSALPLLSRSGAKPDAGVIIRPWAEKRVHSQLRDVSDTRGRRSGSNNEETTYVGHVEVIHPSTKVMLIEVEGEVQVDPFTEAPTDAEFDPAPQLTRLMEQLMSVAVKKLGAHLADRAATQALPPLSLALTPVATFRFSDRRASAELDMAKMNSVDLELFRQSRTRYLTPTLTDAEATAISKLPPGLYVRKAPGDMRLMLNEGDLLTTIDDQPALPQVVARLRFASAPGSVKVRQKSGAIIDTLLP